jgi:hypothetical protein
MNMDINDKNRQDKSALFEARDPSETFKGTERRRRHRRGHNDRREETRFNMEKTDRRACEGRRGDDKRPSFW